MISEIIDVLLTSSTGLLAALGTVFTDTITLLFDAAAGYVPTDLGVIVIATAGFALAFAGIRFIFGLLSRLTNASRGGGSR